MVKDRTRWVEAGHYCHDTLNAPQYPKVELSGRTIPHSPIPHPNIFPTSLDSGILTIIQKLVSWLCTNQAPTWWPGMRDYKEQGSGLLDPLCKVSYPLTEAHGALSGHHFTATPAWAIKPTPKCGCTVTHRHWRFGIGFVAREMGLGAISGY